MVGRSVHCKSLACALGITLPLPLVPPCAVFAGCPTPGSGVLLCVVWGGVTSYYWDLGSKPQQTSVQLGHNFLHHPRSFPHAVVTQVNGLLILLRVQKVGHKNKFLHYLSFMHFYEGFFLSIFSQFFKISKTRAQLRMC